MAAALFAVTVPNLSAVLVFGVAIEVVVVPITLDCFGDSQSVDGCGARHIAFDAHTATIRQCRRGEMTIERPFALLK